MPIKKLLEMSAYSLGAYTADRDRLAAALGLKPQDILYFNAEATVGKPACFLAVNHKSKEYLLPHAFTLESSPPSEVPKSSWTCYAT